jgi:hypothetical protein
MSIDNIEKLKNEKLADIIFTYAGICHVDNINEDIENGCDNDITNPNQKGLDQTIKALIKDYNRKQSFKEFLMSTKKASKVAAIILVSVLILSVSLISSVDAIRVKFLNLFIETNEDYSKITIGDDSNSGSMNTLKNDVALKNCYIPGFIPKGFNIENIIKQNEKTIMVFKDTNSNSLVFEQSSDLNADYMVDTENAEIETIEIQGWEAMVITKDRIITILWDNNEMMFNVSGQMPIEEVVKFCENTYLRK